MNFSTLNKFKIQKPKWVIASFVETTQAAADNILKGYDRVKQPVTDHDKKLRSDLTPSTRNEHSYTSVSSPSKVQRDVFGATILPSNLSFDNMKKLSMNQIKLEEIPLVDENNVADNLTAEKELHGKESSKASSTADIEKVCDQEEGDLDSLVTINSIKTIGDISKTDPFEDIPGPRFLESLATTLSQTARCITVYVVLRLLKSRFISPFKKYGPIVRLPSVMGGKILILNRMEDILSLYEQDRPCIGCSCVDALECSRLRRHGKIKKGFATTDTDWEDVRKVIDDVLCKAEEKYFDGFEENGNQFVRYIKSIKNRENEVPDDFIMDINHWSVETVLHILFDKSFGFLDSERMKWPSKNAKLLTALCDASKNLNICENGFQIWRFIKTSYSLSLDNSCHILETILSHYIYEAQMELLSRDDDPKTEPNSFVEGMLLQDGITKTDVLTSLIDNLVIGMNATSHAFAFLLYHLAKNPRVQDELFTEIRKYLPEKHSRLEYDHLSSLKYLQICLKESLRLQTPMPISMKHLTKDLVLSNFHIPRNTFAVMNMQTEALKEENFEAAHEFRPERWIETEKKHLLPSISLSTHSPNTSEGRLAEIAVMTCIAPIIRNFNVEFNYGSLKTTSSTISYPTTPLKFSFLEREN